jgi:hypothetical protein
VDPSKSRLGSRRAEKGRQESNTGGGGRAAEAEGRSGRQDHQYRRGGEKAAEAEAERDWAKRAGIEDRRTSTAVHGQDLAAAISAQAVARLSVYKTPRCRQPLSAQS